MSGKILVVDDNPLNVKLLAARLTREYYAVMTANSGKAMLQQVQTEPPDLILLDVMMPEMNGYEACRLLRADPTTRHIPVIMVTALSDTENRIKGLEAGAQDFLSKPIHDVALFARVRSLLRLKMVMDEWRLRQATSHGMGMSELNNPDDVSTADPILLIVADDQSEALGITRAVKALGSTIHVVNNLAAAQAILLEHTVDAVICSLNLRQDDGLRICPELRGQERNRHVPIILLGDQNDYERVTRGLDLGANDYLLHPIDPVEIQVRVQNQVRYCRSYKQLRQNYEQSLSLALTDALTGSFNRRYFDHHLPRLMHNAVTSNRSLSLLVVDVDHFKRINDGFGHSAGDTVLKELAARLLFNLRPSDFVTRYGGEEFVVVLPEADSDTAQAIANRLLQLINLTPFMLKDVAHTITISIGVATMRDQETPAALFQRADGATYGAKQAGRNRVVIAE
jgi:two-component system, cell cycle response regulator